MIRRPRFRSPTKVGHLGSAILEFQRIVSLPAGVGEALVEARRSIHRDRWYRRSDHGICEGSIRRGDGPHIPPDAHD